MKRAPELRVLSSDHHRALVLARRAKKAGADETLSVGDIWSDIEKDFRTGLEPHFNIEELYIGAALEGLGKYELAEKLYAEHKALRKFFQSGCGRSSTDLQNFGKLLEEHVRFEERELFEVAQELLSSEMLYAIEKACSKESPGEQ